MVDFTEEQLKEAAKILKERDQQQHEDDAFELALQLRKSFRYLVEDYLRVTPVKGEWLCEEILGQVVYQSLKSLEDFRHRYPYAVTAFKYISIVTFWTVKLKPINSLGLKRDGKYVECPDINERIALKWIEMQIWQLVNDNKLSEFLPGTDEIKTAVRDLFKIYFHDEMYHRKAIDPGDEEFKRNNKSYETAYYMRFKKMTAINIYESLTHMFLPLKSGFLPAKAN